ncbi:uncharacterized protein LOC135502401 [Lineus longissimus]|uniref:uncharacterized protein LOC135502401 n=1 Tax=Lineus longissimus TaxID=88925 RepID=UPI00315CE6BD
MMKWQFFLFGTAILGVALPGAYSVNDITVQPGPVRVKQGQDISLWCKLKYVPKRQVPVNWQSPPTFKTRTSDCLCYGNSKEKYAMSCSNPNDHFRFYNMTIRGVEWVDNGRYCCRYINDKDTVDLQVLVPVTNVTLEKGVPKSATDPQRLYENFTCTTNCASPAPKISWFVNDQHFNGNATVRELDCSGAKEGQKRTESRVTIISTDMDKERKEYNISCTAENVLGEPKVSTVISVNNDALTGIYSRTDITVQPGPVKVIQGHSVSLCCELKYDPDNVLPVLWQSPPNFKRRTVDCYSSLKDKYVMSCSDTNDDVEYYNMTIMDVQWGDNGTYRCLYSKHMDLVDLQVLVPVTDVSLKKIVSPSTAEEPQGYEHLTCKTNCAFPAPKISWFVNDQPFNGNATVRELDCSGAKEGQKQTMSTVLVMSTDMNKERKEHVISCTAENVLGEPKVSKAISVNNDALTSIYSQTDITVQPGPVKVIQGHSVSLWCKLKYDPDNVLPVLWHSPPNFKTRTVNCDSFVKDKYVMSCSDTNDDVEYYNMTIMDVQWGDNGTYWCLYSKHMDHVDLQVLVPVTDVSLKKIVSPSTAEEPQRYEYLTCKTNCAFPAPKISWFVNDQPFNGKTMVNESDCSGAKDGQKQTMSTLLVVSTDMDEERKEYVISCTAENVIGEPKVSKAISVNNVALTSIYSRTDITVQPGPVKVIQGHSVSLWCKLKYDPDNVLPVVWHSPPNFKTRTVDCDSFVKNKYVMACSDTSNAFEYYNMTIMDVQWADNGIYRCLYTKHMDIVDLQVLVPVTDVTLEKIVSLSTAEEPQRNEYLTCKTNCAFPAPKISWFVNDQPFHGTVSVTELDCSGAKKGQKRTESRVRVVSPDMDKERKEYDISCTAENVIGEPKVSKAIAVNNVVNPGPPQRKTDEIASAAATTALSPRLVTAVIIIVVLEKYCQQLIREH